jgi:hypothetical protein
MGKCGKDGPHLRKGRCQTGLAFGIHGSEATEIAILGSDLRKNSSGLVALDLKSFDPTSYAVRDRVA